jgi:peroxiredoxin
MVLITQSGKETLAIGKKGPDFKGLPGTDGKSYGLADFKGKKAVVINFTCNHCPYAKAYEDRFQALVSAFSPKGVGFIAINANDASNYPDDAMGPMKARVAEKGFTFPYVRDDDQSVAKAYGAVCTPHVFVLDAEGTLVYEGRIDDSWKDPAAATSHDLRDALEAVLAGKPVPAPQTNPMGCSIKWRA